MKNSFALMSAAVLLALSSCNNNKNNTASTDSITTESTESQNVSTASYEVVPGNYVNLNTGKTVHIIRDPQTGYAMDSIANTPVEFYINPSTNDTLYQNGMIVNHSLVKTNGKWDLSEDAKVKIKDDKVKIEDDSTKIKVTDDKTKIKSGDYKQKVEDGETKTKNGDTKTTTDNK